jgi:DNA (cytosine-5)-methyltransferase 1
MGVTPTTKHCETCGTEYSTKRPDRAKYCSFCVAAGAILHYGERTKKCLACEAVFCVSDRRDILCASCDHNPRFCRAVVTGKCRYCHASPVNVADKDIPVCFSCWKDPAVRAAAHPDAGQEARGAHRRSRRMKPILIDACCGAGGATKGYQRVGFHVIGVDIAPQPNYCGDEFVQMDVIEFLDTQVYARGPVAFHASVPCQAYSPTWKIQKNEHPDLVGPVRQIMREYGLPYVIENVPGSPLIDPVELCGAMFPPLQVYRHRLFETSFPLPQPPHVPHTARQVKMGRPAESNEWLQVVGNFSGAERAREAMGTPWMTRSEMAEAIPPAYTEWVGRFLLDHINTERLEQAA